MNTPRGGQSSQTSGDDREPTLAHHWYDIPPGSLWQFVVDLVAVHSLRGVAEMAELSKETVRKYISRIGDPKTTTRKKLGELFLRIHPGGAMQEPADGHAAELRLRKPLIELLPRGEEEALATLSLIFDVAKRIPRHVSPRILDAVHRWMELQVRGEYDAERFYAQFNKRKRPPQPRGEPRKPKRAEPEPGGGDDG